MYRSHSGADNFLTLADELDDREFRRSRGEEVEETDLSGDYAEPEPKVASRLERLKDMVIYRFGGTGAWQAVQTAVELKPKRKKKQLS